jgi:hypothetical protein
MKDMQYPPSPLSILGEEDRNRSLSKESSIPSQQLSHSTTSSSSSSGLPLTPSSAITAIPPIPGNPVIGTIEFEIDIESAPWLDTLRRKSVSSATTSRHRRKVSSVSDGGGSVSVGSQSNSNTSIRGIRELRLPKKVNDGRMRFLKELDPNMVEDMDDIFGGAFRSANTSMSRDDSDRSLGDSMKDDTGSGRLFESLRPPKERRPSLRHGMGTISQSASFDDFAEEGVEGDVTGEDEKRDIKKEMDEMVALLEKNGWGEGKQVELGARFQQVREDVDKRGSGIVMAEELDDLEKSKFVQADILNRYANCPLISYAISFTSGYTVDFT